MPASTAGQDDGHRVRSGFFFGRIAFENEVIAVDIRQRHVRVFVTDAEPGGTAEWFEGSIRGERMSLVSASRQSRPRARLEDSHGDWLGTITLPSGRKRAFAVTLAEFGAGIYRVTVSGDGRYRGRSIDGKRLRARHRGQFLAGRITERNGDSRAFRIMDLSQAYDYSRKSGAPGTYTTIVSRRGTLVYGRSGVRALERWRPGRNILAFDIAASARPTPGFYFGKVASSRAVVGVKVDPPDAEGGRRIRIYSSDSEPEPRGVVEWFSGRGVGDTLSLTSASGTGRVTATITAGLVSGTITFEDGVPRRFFSLPAGEGAGIYDVVISQSGRIVGRSEEGGRFTARQDGLFVAGSLKAPDGRRYKLHIGDLTRNLRYGLKGNKPDDYVAIVAPRGRFIFGRSNGRTTRDVRVGRPGTDILGLDKAC